MQVTQHDEATFLLYSNGDNHSNGGMTISLFRRMSEREAEFAYPHQSLQGGVVKWLSESFIKAAAFTNADVNERTVILEYCIDLAYWRDELRVRAVHQRAAGHNALQFHYEGIYHDDGKQDGPFRNYGIPPGEIPGFNAHIIEVRYPNRVDYRTHDV